MAEKRGRVTVRTTAVKTAAPKTAAVDKPAVKPSAAEKSAAEQTSHVKKVTAVKRTPASGRSVATRARGRSRDLPTIAVSEAAGGLFSQTGAVERVVTALGNNIVADILGVSRSQPSRWKSGVERIGPENRKRISDLDHILDRLLLELYPAQAGAWLTGPNASLGGARPIDVLELRGPAAVLGAIDALAVGAFA